MADTRNYERDYNKKKNHLLSQLPDFVEEYICDRTKVAPNTLCGYTEDIDYFLNWIVQSLPYFCEKKVLDISVEDLSHISVKDMNKFISRYSETHKPRTVARKKASISAFFSYLYKNGSISANPMSAAECPKIKETPLIYLTEDEQIDFLNCIEFGTGLTKKQLEYHKNLWIRDYAIVILFLDTGLRVSELRGIRFKDLNLDKCFVNVLRKEDRDEIVYFSDGAADALKNYIDSKGKDKKDKEYYIFTDLEGNQLSVKAIENMVKKYATAALPGKKISPHKLRSSFAMSFYKATNNDILLLQKRMSHKNITTTNIYAKASDEAVKESRNWH